MPRIEMEIWKPTSENSRSLTYVGQRTTQEVFEELRHHLESIGYLPDEYFLIGRDWENNREIPKDADIFCTTNYGDSEGIYLDIYLSWYDKQQNNNTTKFATGKTLGETSLDLDRMHLISSAIMNAFHSDGVHARYIRLGEPAESDACIIHLNNAERRILIDSLMEKHSRLMDETRITEQLLRRVTGSITEYINEMGRLPMETDDFDLAVLAIRDGNLQVLTELIGKLPDKIGDLLVHSAGRPGKIGKQMTKALLEEAKGIPNELFYIACKKAIETSDTERVRMMAEKAVICRTEDDLTIFGDIISHALSTYRQLVAQGIVNLCTPNMIKAANPHVLVLAINKQDFDMAEMLVDKGIDANRVASEIIHVLTQNTDNRFYFNVLLKRGMKIDSVNYSAMQSCIKTDSLLIAKLLLDDGMDFDLYTTWAESNNAIKDGEVYDEIKKYWENK